MTNLLQIYGSSLPSLLVFMVALAIVGIMAVVFVTGLLSFAYTQVGNLYMLYTEPVNEAEIEYHPYTVSILQNECPELLELQRLSELPRTKMVRREMVAIVQSMVDTLEMSESEPIKDEIIVALKGVV